MVKKIKLKKALFDLKPGTILELFKEGERRMYQPQGYIDDYKLSEELVGRYPDWFEIIRDPIMEIFEKMAEEKSVEVDSKLLRLRKPKEMLFEDWQNTLLRLANLGVLITVHGKENKK